MGRFQKIREDVQSVFERDPAATSLLMVLFCYPGLHAVWAHRVTHWFWRHRCKFVARFLSQVARLLTGIEIHPGATIGRRLFIDHGMGVVVGETAILGDDVTLYQGVTLGGTGKDKGKRHPTLHNGVFVGNNANVLGNITIGENSRVGAGSVVLQDVPPNSTVVGVPAHIVYREGKRVLITDINSIKDPLTDVIKAMNCRIDAMKKRLDDLQAVVENEEAVPVDQFGQEDAERASYKAAVDSGMEDGWIDGGGI